MKSWHDVWDELGSSLLNSVKTNNLEIDFSDFMSSNGFNHSHDSEIEAKSFDNYLGKVASFLGYESRYLYEFGCGSGYFASLLAKKLGTTNFGGSDNSEAMINVARHLYPNNSFSVSDACNFKCLEDQATIVCNSVFQYFPDLKYARKVVRNVLSHHPRSFAFLDLVRSSVNGSLKSRAGRTSSAKLTHLGFSENFFTDMLGSSNHRVSVMNQSIQGYNQSSSRFNVIGIRND